MLPLRRCDVTTLRRFSSAIDRRERASHRTENAAPRAVRESGLVRSRRRSNYGLREVVLSLEKCRDSPILDSSIRRLSPNALLEARRREQRRECDRNRGYGTHSALGVKKTPSLVYPRASDRADRTRKLSLYARSYVIGRERDGERDVERFPFNLVPLQVQQGIRHELISSQLVLDTRTRDDGRASRSDSGAYRETVRVKRSIPRRGSTRIDADPANPDVV